MAEIKAKKTDDKRIHAGFVAQAGKGRPKGVKNKVTMQLKEMILGALDDAGGQEYLTRQAIANPAAFLSLIGKILPTQVTGDKDNPVSVDISGISESAKRELARIKV